MIFFWPKVYGPLGKTPYIYPRYQVWGVTDLNFDLAYYHPPLPVDQFRWVRYFRTKRPQTRIGTFLCGKTFTVKAEFAMHIAQYFVRFKFFPESLRLLFLPVSPQTTTPATL